MDQQSWPRLQSTFNNLEKYLHREARVRIDVGQREEVGGADEKVAVKGVWRDSPSATHAHHRLEADLAGEVSKGDLFLGTTI